MNEHTKANTSIIKDVTQKRQFNFGAGGLGLGAGLGLGLGLGTPVNVDATVD